MLHPYPKIYHTYLWLVDLIRRHNGLTLEQINEKWLESELSGGVTFHRNTFRRYVDAIDEMLGIRIEPSSKGRNCRYSISKRHTEHERALNGWMLSTLSIANIVKERKSLQKRIMLEEAPEGNHLLMEITQAMQRNVLLHITYQKFVDDEPYEADVEPYCIKLFHQRWYLLAHRLGRDYLAIYAFDRMLSATATTTQFEFPRDFNSEEHFAHLYGVFQGRKGEEHKRITLRTYNGEWNYLRTLPLHHTQCELPAPSREPQYIDFTVELYPTFDFLLEILSHGSNIEILKPAAVREEMERMITDMAARYTPPKN